MRRQILTPVVLPLLLAGLSSQAVVPFLRVTTTYRALEAGFGAQTIGLLSAVFALLPVFLTITIGRLNDRGHAALGTLAGGGAILLGAVILSLAPAGLVWLLLGSIALGLGHSLCVTTMQLIATTSSARAHRDQMLGNYMVAMALGQAVGPLLVGLGSDPVLRFALPAAGSAVLILSAMRLVRVVPKRRRESGAEPVPLRAIAATPGLTWIVLTGAITVSAQDLLLAFLPLLGDQRGIPPATVGVLLAIRAAATMASRVVFGRAVRYLGRMRLTLIAVGAGGSALVLLALPIPVWVIGVAMVLAGFGLGIALTSTIALVLQIARPEVRGTSLSLRMTANRIAQFGLPLVAGVVVAPLGVGGIFGLAGAALIGAVLLRPRALR